MRPAGFGALKTACEIDKHSIVINVLDSQAEKSFSAKMYFPLGLESHAPLSRPRHYFVNRAYPVTIQILD
jgi:hypothetical protein